MSNGQFELPSSLRTQIVECSETRSPIFQPYFFIRSMPMMMPVRVRLSASTCSGAVLISGTTFRRSEERRVGKDVSVRVDLGGRRIIKKKTRDINNKKN